MLNNLSGATFIPCGIRHQTLEDLEEEKKETDPGDVPNSEIWFGSIVETLFSKSLGQTEIYALLIYNISPID